MRTIDGQVVVDPMVQELKDKQLRIKGRFSEDSAESILKSNGAVKAVQMDQNGLVVPRKLHNPCLESRECQDLNREIRWNAKAGIDVLNTKSELQRVMEKRNLNRKEKERIIEEESKKSPFQKMLEERAKRLERLEAHTEEGGHSSEDSGHCSPEPESEFLKVHGKLTAGKFSS